MNCSNCGYKLDGYENLCKFCGFKIPYPKTYRVLILINTLTGGKIKEESWELSKENAEKFVDESGTAYVMAYPENGEIEYALTEKNIWLETKKLWDDANINEYKIPSWDKLTEGWKKRDDMFLRLAGEPKIIEVLKKYGRKSSQEAIKEIHGLLLSSGAGFYVSKSVIKDPKLLSKYLQMKVEGKSDLEIQYECRKMLGDL